MGETISVQIATCTLEIIPDVLFAEMPIENQRKLLRSMFKDAAKNEQAIAALNEYLPRATKAREKELLNAAIALKKDRKNKILQDKTHKSKTALARILSITRFFNALHEKYKNA